MNMPPDTRFAIRSGNPLRGTVQVPGDKSLSHRAVMLGSIAGGTSRVRNWLAAGDTEATLGAVRSLGVAVDRVDANTLTIHGGELHASPEPLDFMNAGTGIRLMVGIMAGQPFASVLDGSEQLRRRPMKRVTEPLVSMGANIQSTNGRAPLKVQPANLHGVDYDMPVASGQVKSCLLLAGLYADGPTTIREPGPARDHTENMLRSMGAKIEVTGNTVTLTPGGVLKPFDMTVPGDFSSAAFIITAACIVPDSDVIVEHVNLNETRTGLLDALLEMGADITVTETGEQAGEPVGNLHVRHGELRGIEIGGELVVRMIDEFPVLMVAALKATGKTIVRDAHELRVKETDRLAVMTSELTKLGANIRETDDGFVIEGPQSLVGAAAHGHDDHRIAMSMAVAGLVATKQTVVDDARCTADSFPGFDDLLRELGAEMETVPTV
jgi:3-phosphoshikimate 1-carboxyvinyltransferase